MKNIVLIGMPGCGKSTLGKQLAQKLQRSFFDADDVVVKREQRSIKEMFAESEAVFRKAETATIKYLANLDGVIIATGGGVVLRQENIKMLKQNGVVIFIDRQVENIVTNIDNTARPLLANDKMRIYALYEQRINLYRKYADIIIDNNDSAAVTSKKLFEYVKEAEK